MVIEDYCLRAQVDLSMKALYIPYMPLPGEELVVKIDYELIEESFSVDEEHRDVCSPIIFDYKV